MPKRASAPKTIDPIDERLMSAAIKVFLEKGFEAASIDEIAATAKASKLTFYHRFGNKEGLFEAVVNRENAAIVETLSSTSSQGKPLAEFLQYIANRFWAALLVEGRIALLRVLHAETERFPRLANVFDQSGPARGVQLLAAELKILMDAGQVRRADPLLAAEQFIHLSLGEVTRRTLLGVTPAFTKAEIRRRITEGINTFLRAYASDQDRC